jgi:hypothetical protein
MSSPNPSTLDTSIENLETFANKGFHKASLDADQLFQLEKLRIESDNLKQERIEANERAEQERVRVHEADEREKVRVYEADEREKVRVHEEQDKIRAYQLRKDQEKYAHDQAMIQLSIQAMNKAMELQMAGVTLPSALPSATAGQWISPPSTANQWTSPPSSTANQWTSPPSSTANQWTSPPSSTANQWPAPSWPGPSPSDDEAWYNQGAPGGP